MWMLISMLFACGEAAPEPQPEAPVAAAPAPEDPHAAHGKHMAEMAATRERLRTELGEAYDQPVAGLDAASVEAGRALYEQHCASCHGPEGKGDGPAAAGLNPPPGDLTDSFHARYYSDPARLHIIRKGIAGTGMPGFEAQLSDAQALDLYAYVRTLRGQAGEAAPAHDHGAGH